MIINGVSVKNSIGESALEPPESSQRYPIAMSKPRIFTKATYACCLRERNREGLPHLPDLGLHFHLGMRAEESDVVGGLEESHGSQTPAISRYQCPT